MVRLARRIQKGDAQELREIHSTVPRINIGWIVLVAIIAGAMIARWRVDSYVLAGLLFAVTIVLRPVIYRMMRH